MDSPIFQNDRIYNSRIIDTYLRFIKAKYPFVETDLLLTFSSMTKYEVADQAHWFTQSQIDRFYEKAVHLTGNENIAREAGRFAASPDALGAMRQYLLGMFSPLQLFEKIGQTAENLTRSATYTCKKISPNKVEIVVTPKAGSQEKLFQCENRMGFFEALVILFNHDIPRISHTECAFKDSPACKYIISWNDSKATGLAKIRLIACILSLPIYAYAITALPHTKPLIPALFLAQYSLFTLLVERSKTSELNIIIQNIRNSSEQLVDQIKNNYNNISLTSEISHTINNTESPETVLEKITKILQNRLEYDRGLILFSDPQQTYLKSKSSFGYNPEQLEIISTAEFSLNKPNSSGIFVLAFREKRPFLINDLSEIELSLSAKSLEFARKLGVKSFVCCPILCESEAIGILTVDNIRSRRPLVQSDISLLMGIANVIGIGIRNAELLESKVEQFKSLLQVLAASTDARDFMTAGHSEKVTQYSVGICQELGLTTDFTEMIRVAALLHDYGKIGIPDSILKKTGTLTPEEYEVVKTHASRTKEILRQINFEGIYKQVPEIAGAHHEKVDGTGYPDHLKGHEIPLGAKIIAVADFFDAITSKRHYREPMLLDDARQMLIEGIDSAFDEQIVEAFLRYLKNNHKFLNISRDRGPKSAKRITYRTPVSLKLEQRFLFGTSSDISSTGLYISTESQVEKNRIIELTFTPPNQAYNIDAIGRVAWVNFNPDRHKPTLPPGFGVEFIEIASKHKEHIEHFIHCQSEIKNNIIENQLTFESCN